MTKLPAEAYAIIQGNHTDPFHYLGLHSEGGQNVVRAFLPEASNVEAIGEHGERAPLTRIHDAGLFTGALPNGSTRYQLRARFGDKLGELQLGVPVDVDVWSEGREADTTKGRQRASAAIPLRRSALRDRRRKQRLSIGKW